VDELRELMRRVPAPVGVLTFEVEGRRYGVTVGSVVSLSLEPPLVGVSIGLQSSTHAPFRETEMFAINALGGDQDGLAQHFARSVPPIALWNGIEVRDDDPRLLVGAAGWLTVRTVEEVRTGDHTFFVGELLSVEEGRAADSLCYVHRGYHAL
jgi:flavin reductase (DIM6/NTAB) family NADH-FMN oxidoreductase RutF